ncbi:tetratricopeptide repeat protein [Gimesia algae]|uniref:NACHT domain protein n=1 Tax=Gimesia algae TaxID=2527971 RepID=A0A517VA97_9PLAN|nr:tetratricopeptide repeat protein [Gimesia algae]QDT89933.1 NACHT domain protein [Gimesia algae]
MTFQWKTIRVFISSTFRDMQAERDHLVKYVFPALRARLEPHRIRLIEIDLRWGLTKEQAESDQVLDLCLQQIDHCRPYFIGLLGERYGWVPRSLPSEATAKYEWLKERESHSITELEVLHGVLNHPEMDRHSLFYFRDATPIKTIPSDQQSLLLEMASQNEIEELGEAAAHELVQQRRDRLNTLKQSIKNSGRTIVTGYHWQYEGMKIRWSAAQLLLEDNDREQLRALAEDGMIDPGEYASLKESSPHLQRFVDQYGTIALSGLESFGRQVYEQFWDLLCTDPQFEGLAAADAESRGEIATHAEPEQYSIPELKSLLKEWSRSAGFEQLDQILALDDQQFAVNWMLLSNHPQLKEWMEMFKLWISRRQSVNSESLEDLSQLNTEQEYHQRFIESRLRVYVKRREAERKIFDYLNHPGQAPLVIVGDAGSGKSAIMAKVCQVMSWLANRSSRFFVIGHFIGVSPDSTSVDGLLRRILLEISAQCDLRLTLETETSALADQFRQVLKELPPERHLVLFLDALDQLDASHHALDLHWLPVQFPENVTLVMSCLPDNFRGAEESSQVRSALNLRDHRLLDLRDFVLTSQDCRKIIEEVPSLAAKSLDSEQIELLLTNPATRNPLYLMVALEELRGFGSFELLRPRIQLFEQADDPTKLLSQLITWLSYDFDKSLVSDVLCGIAVSRIGLSESELHELVVLDLPAETEENMIQKESRQKEIASLLRHLRTYLQNRGALLDFYHRSVLRAVRKTLLTEEVIHEMHRKLARLFDFRETHPDSEGRVAPLRSQTELLFHLEASEQWDQVQNILMELDLVQPKAISSNWRQLVDEFYLALRNAPLKSARILTRWLSRLTIENRAFHSICRDTFIQLAVHHPDRFQEVVDQLDMGNPDIRQPLLECSALQIGAGNGKTAVVILEGMLSALGESPVDQKTKGSIFQQLAVAFSGMGHEKLPEAEREARAGLNLAIEIDDQLQIPIAQTTLIEILSRQGKFEEAKSIAWTVIQENQDGAMQRIVPRACLYLSTALRTLREFEGYEEMMTDGMMIGSKLGQTEEYVRLVEELSSYHSEQGNIKQSISLLEEAIALPVTKFQPNTRLMLMQRLASRLLQNGNFERARLILEEGLTIATQPVLRASFLTTWITYHCGLNQFEEAWNYANEAEDAARLSPNRFHSVEVLQQKIHICYLAQWFERLSDVAKLSETVLRQLKQDGLAHTPEFERSKNLLVQEQVQVAIKVLAAGPRHSNPDALNHLWDLCTEFDIPSDLAGMIAALQAITYINLANEAEGRIWLDRASKLKQSLAQNEVSADFLLIQAGAQSRLGNHTEIEVAVAQMLKTIETDPHIPTVELKLAYIQSLSELANSLEIWSAVASLCQNWLSIQEKNEEWGNSQKGSMLYTFAETQRLRGATDSALDLIQQYIDSVLNSYGIDSPHLILPYYRLGQILSDKGQLEAAYESLSQGLALARVNAQNADDAQVATGECYLTLFACKLNRLDEARETGERILKDDIRLFGPDNINTAMSQFNMALVEKAEGHLEQAEILLRQALNVLQNNLAGDNPRIGECQSNLAHILLQKGETDQARSLLYEALDNQRHRLLPAHPALQQSEEWLASINSG